MAWQLVSHQLFWCLLSFFCFFLSLRFFVVNPVLGIKKKRLGHDQEIIKKTENLIKKFHEIEGLIEKILVEIPSWQKTFVAKSMKSYEANWEETFVKEKEKIDQNMSKHEKNFKMIFKMQIDNLRPDINKISERLLDKLYG